MTDPDTYALRLSWCNLALAVVIGLCAPASLVLPVLRLPFSSMMGMALMQLLVLYTSDLCFTILIAIVGLFFRRFRRIALLLLASLVLFAGSFYFGGVWGVKLRMDAFRDLGERSKPLVAAIHQYEDDNGRPPDQLADLVPDYMSEIPETGMNGYGEYNYSTRTDIRANQDGNPWVLWVDASEFMQFDLFLYFPLQNYPERGYGGLLERLGDWAYVHE